MTEFVIYSMTENGREKDYHRKRLEIIQFLSSLMEISLAILHRYRQRIKLQQQKTGDRLGSKERSFFREKIQKQSRDFWRFSVISHSCENPTRTWCFLSANFRLLDYNLTNFVFFKRVIIEC